MPTIDSVIKPGCPVLLQHRSDTGATMMAKECAWNRSTDPVTIELDLQDPAQVSQLLGGTDDNAFVIVSDIRNASQDALEALASFVRSPGSRTLVVATTDIPEPLSPQMFTDAGGHFLSFK